MRAAVLLAALVALLAGAAPASAQVSLLAPEDAADLTNSLADAQDAQGVCYGYVVRINGIETDLGSSTEGPGRPLAVDGCTGGWTQLEADLTYTCDTCEGEDSASVAVNSSFPEEIDVSELEALGWSSGDLLGEQDDVALIGMVGVLPLLNAELGNAEFVDYELARDVPAADRPTGSPGSDFLRERWPLLALCGFLFVLGPAYWARRRSQIP